MLQVFAKGDLVKVLKGTGDYAIGFDQWVGAVAPTDWTQVLSLFYNYANSIGTTKANIPLRNTVIIPQENNHILHNLDFLCMGSPFVTWALTKNPTRHTK